MPIRIDAPKNNSTRESILGKDTTQLQCTASGSHINDISWQKNGQPLASNPFYMINTSTVNAQLSYQKETMVSVLTFIHHQSMSCDDMKTFTGAYSCVVEGSAAGVSAYSQSGFIAVNAKCKFVSFFFLFLIIMHQSVKLTGVI